MKQTVLSTYAHSTREPKEIIYVQDTLNFTSEELLHTYDSSYERYNEANQILVEHFNKVLLKNYLPALSKPAYQTYRRVFLQYGETFTTWCHKQTLAVLMETFIEYVTAKGLNSFDVKPVNTTNQLDGQEYVQAYKDIKVEGVLNFAAHNLINSTYEYYGKNSSVARAYDAVEFTYPQEGEKQAFVSFVVSDDKHESVKKFKIKSIQIVAVYKIKFIWPYMVYRDKDVFPNGTGFLIKFQLDNFDRTYEFLLGYISNYIARAFDQTIGD